MQNSLRTLICVAAIALAGCSSFDRRFAEASRARPTDDPLAGAYSGKWSSSQHPGGGGDLRCIMTPLASAGTQAGRDYRADFHATWHGLSSEHTVVLQTKPSRKGRGTRNFTGTSKLSAVMGSGTYRCEGTVDGKRMHATYDASYDKGTFDMKRVGAQ
jgi:hypothetical protein